MSAEFIIWLAAILLITAVGLFVAAPLSDRPLNRKGFINIKDERNQHDHALAVQALRELEFDRAMGKLDADDYRQLSEKLEKRALAAMGARRVRESLSGEVAPYAGLVSIAANQAGAVNSCPHCSARVGRAYSFCANCGHALAPNVTAEN